MGESSGSSGREGRFPSHSGDDSEGSEYHPSRDEISWYAGEQREYRPSFDDISQIAVSCAKEVVRDEAQPLLPASLHKIKEVVRKEKEIPDLNTPPEVTAEQLQRGYYYSQKKRKHCCLIPGCVWEDAKKQRLEQHLKNAHNIEATVEKCKKGRPMLENVKHKRRPDRDTSNYYLGYSLDPEYRYRANLRRTMKKCKKYALEIARKNLGSMCDGAPETEEDIEAYAEDWCNRRMSEWEAHKEEKIAQFKKNIVKGYGLEGCDEKDWCTYLDNVKCGLQNVILNSVAVNEDGPATPTSPPSLSAPELDLNAAPVKKTRGRSMVAPSGQPQSPMRTMPMEIGESSMPAASRRTMLSLTADVQIDVHLFQKIQDLFNIEFSTMGKKKSGKSMELSYNCQWPLHMKSPLWRIGSAKRGEFIIDREDAECFERQGSDNPDKQKTSWISDDSVGLFYMLLSHTVPTDERNRHCWLHPTLVEVFLRCRAAQTEGFYRYMPPARSTKQQEDDPIHFYWLPTISNNHWSLFLFCADEDICSSLGTPAPTLLSFDSIPGYHAPLLPDIRDLLRALHTHWKVDYPSW